MLRIPGIAVQEHDIHADCLGASNVVLHVVPNVQELVGTNAQMGCRNLENSRMWLGVPNLARGDHDREVP